MQPSANIGTSAPLYIVYCIPFFFHQPCPQDMAAVCPNTFCPLWGQKKVQFPLARNTLWSFPIMGSCMPVAAMRRGNSGAKRLNLIPHNRWMYLCDWACSWMRPEIREFTTVLGFSLKMKHGRYLSQRAQMFPFFPSFFGLFRFLGMCLLVFWFLFLTSLVRILPWLTALE